MPIFEHQYAKQAQERGHLWYTRNASPFVWKAVKILLWGGGKGAVPGYKMESVSESQNRLHLNVEKILHKLHTHIQISLEVNNWLVGFCNASNSFPRFLSSPHRLLIEWSSFCIVKELTPYFFCLRLIPRTIFSLIRERTKKILFMQDREKSNVFLSVNS